MRKTVFNAKRSWTPNRPFYVPGRSYTVRKETSSVDIMKDVYFVELIANPVCDRATIASTFQKLFSNVRVLYADNSASTLPTGEKLNEFCSAVKTLLLSWPGKVIIVGSPEFCAQYAKRIGKPPGDHISRLCNMRPEKRVVVRMHSESVRSLTWQAAVEEKSLSETKIDVNEIVDDNILSLHCRVKDIGKQHFDLIEKAKDGRQNGDVKRCRGRRTRAPVLLTEYFKHAPRRKKKK